MVLCLAMMALGGSESSNSSLRHNTADSGSRKDNHEILGAAIVAKNGAIVVLGAAMVSLAMVVQFSNGNREKAIIFI